MSDERADEIKQLMDELNVTVRFPIYAKGSGKGKPYDEDRMSQETLEKLRALRNAERDATDYFRI